MRRKKVLKLIEEERRRTEEELLVKAGALKAAHNKLVGDIDESVNRMIERANEKFADFEGRVKYLEMQEIGQVRMNNEFLARLDGLEELEELLEELEEPKPKDFPSEVEFIAAAQVWNENRRKGMDRRRLYVPILDCCCAACSAVRERGGWEKVEEPVGEKKVEEGVEFGLEFGRWVAWVCNCERGGLQQTGWRYTVKQCQDCGAHQPPSATVTEWEL